MKRYLLFYGDYYHPQGGWNDFRGSFDTKTEAVEKYIKEYRGNAFGYGSGWGHIVDSTTGESVDL